MRRDSEVSFVFLQKETIISLITSAVLRNKKKALVLCFSRRMSRACFQLHIKVKNLGSLLKKCEKIRTSCRALAKRSNIVIQHRVERICFTVSPPFSTLHLNGVLRSIKIKHFHPAFFLRSKCLIVWPPLPTRLARTGKSNLSETSNVVIFSSNTQRSFVGYFVRCLVKHCFPVQRLNGLCNKHHAGRKCLIVQSGLSMASKMLKCKKRRRKT